MIEMQAAVLRTTGGPFEFETLLLDEPRPDEVLVQLVGTGLCHSDIFMSRLLPGPAVLGHEGAGVVVKSGPDATSFQPGDRVILSYNSCGKCASCSAGIPCFCVDFMQLNVGGSRPDGSKTLHTMAGTEVSGSFFGQSSFATHALAYERNLVKVPADVPDEVFQLLGPLGCGVQTGAGAVMNSLAVEPGSSLVVAGAGSVGLSALLAAVVVGGTTIVAIDLNAERLELARQLGATHTINGADTDVTAQLLAITGHGADNALDTTGNSGVIRSLVHGVRVGGTVGLLGAGMPGSELTLDYNSLSSGRRLRGIVEGDAVPQVFIPRLIALQQAGKFPIEKLVTAYKFEALNQAVLDSEHGGAVKPILLF